VQQVRSRLHDATQALGENAVLDLSLPATRVPTDRVLFSAEGLRVRRGGRDLFGAHGLALTIRGPQRIALRGVNGAGKSTLLRVIAGECTSDGSVRRGAGRVAYLSQRLDLLDPARTVAQNLALAAPDMPAQERANLLARLQFPGDRMDLPALALSGGERLRAVLACCTPRRRRCFCCWMNRPTTSTSMRWTCWFRRCAPTKVRWWWQAMIRCSWRKSI
jgi:ATPase subunit of ABC transporter with duplicated ATPase domains